MAELIHEIPDPFAGPDGALYLVRIVAAERPDGTWAAWIEFHADGGPIRRTERETSQSNRNAVVYWAAGLEPIYLEGAFARSFVEL
jgi:hypothetical protein